MAPPSPSDLLTQPRPQCATDLLPLLKSTFGYDAFRGAQAQVLDRVLSGQSTLAVMPTGAGKSLTYQLPAVALNGTVLIISPLIALMHDQLRSAEAAGIRAATLTSADSNTAETIERFRAGALDLLYVAPERATQSGFQAMLERAELALIAIDEAHCVSEWGHDFRPDYRLLRPLLERFGHVPRLALTATADAHTREDILVQLGMPADGLILSGFDRPNIRYHIEPRVGLPQQLSALMASERGPGIIYAPTRAKVEDLAAKLDSRARPVRGYHAGMPADVRAANQAAFVASENMVMVATIAFGMGIDKPDVRFVAHAALPYSIEGYYQETGRAGRDGDPAVAHLFWSDGDFATARMRLAELPEARQAADRTRLDTMAGLVESAECRRAVLLRYFGEHPPERCGNCDNCLTPPDTKDASVLAQKYLSAVYRTGQSYGQGHLLDVLTGKDSERVVARGHDKLSVFGLIGPEEARLLKPLVRTLTARDALRTNEHGGLMLGPAARAMMKGEVKVAVVAPPKRRASRSDRAAANPTDNPLFAALRAARRDLAQEAAVPPYVICHDSTLREMADTMPMTMAAMSKITGMGAKKLSAYGDAFLAVVRRF